jgi:hypothetical protein
MRLAVIVSQLYFVADVVWTSIYLWVVHYVSPPLQKLVIDNYIYCVIIGFHYKYTVSNDCMLCLWTLIFKSWICMFTCIKEQRNTRVSLVKCMYLGKGQNKDIIDLIGFLLWMKAWLQTVQS